MNSYIIEGGQSLRGEIRISGAKNAALPVLAASMLLEGQYRIENIPVIEDILTLLEIMKSIGAGVELLPGGTVLVDSSTVNTTTAISDQVGRLRGSYYLLGALLGRFGEARLKMPGGCNFGCRPIDLHLKGFSRLGAEVKEEGDIISCKADKLSGKNVFMDVVSVGATINLILAAVRAEGTTVIYNAAKEPHVVDMANFLNSMGASIHGAGTDAIRINGRPVLRKEGSYAIIPDQIEAGTFMAMAALTGGDVRLRNIIPSHLDALVAKMREMGCKIETAEDSLRISLENGFKLKATNFVTAPHPGFPTDMQPQIAVLLTQAEGTGKLIENVWNNRFQYMNDLRSMGASIVTEGRTAFISGISSFVGRRVKAHDLRAGAAMVMAGLIAQGRTEITDVELIERGYEDFIDKMISLGARIERKTSVADAAVSEINHAG